MPYKCEVFDNITLVPKYLVRARGPLRFIMAHHFRFIVIQLSIINTLLMNMLFKHKSLNNKLLIYREPAYEIKITLMNFYSRIILLSKYLIFVLILQFIYYLFT